MMNDARYRILIVDDNINNLYTLKALIETYIDAEVIQADCGKKALRLVDERLIDLVILDIYMEGMDGFEVASIIKSRQNTKDIPIVFLTAAYTNDEFKKRGYRTGAVDYLTKPIDEYQLINRISTYLNITEKERNINILLEQKVKEQTKELRRQTEELRKAKEEAVAASEAKSMFLANISHELRTPLNILLSSTQLINMYIENDSVLDKTKVKNKLDIQTQNCYRLLRLVNNLIDITKINSDHFTLSFQNCNIVQIVEAITMSVAEYISGKGIQLIFTTNIEEKIIKCDLDAVERMILNLLSNAIKFTPEGGKITVGMEDLGDGIKIAIKDTGIGIQQEMLEMIFEKFKQADHLMTRKHEGSGIGLSLVKSLVEMHGGYIRAESEYQSGSEFIIHLPAASTSPAKEDDRQQIFYSSQIPSNVIQKINIEFSDIYF